MGLAFFLGVLNMLPACRTPLCRLRLPDPGDLAPRLFAPPEDPEEPALAAEEGVERICESSGELVIRSRKGLPLMCWS